MISHKRNLFLPAKAAGNTVSMIFWYVSLVLYQRCQGKRGHFENHPLFETSIPGTVIEIR